jgi:hypothetical protein
MKLNLTTIFLLIFSISISNSHGFGERIDLPIPLELYLLGAGVTIILSFFVISTFSNKLEGKTELIQFSKNSKLNLAVNKLLIFLKVFLVIVLAVVIIACFFRPSNSDIQHCTHSCLDLFWSRNDLCSFFIWKHLGKN